MFKLSSLALLSGGALTSISHAATVTPPVGGTSNWDQTWTNATVASANSPFNLLPAASVPDLVIINQNRVIQVDSAIDVVAGDVVLNNTNDTAFIATLEVNPSGSLSTGKITVGGGNDEGFLKVQGGDLSVTSVTVSGNSPLNEATVTSGTLSTSANPALNLQGGNFTLSSGTVTLTDPAPGGGTFNVTGSGGVGALNVEGGDFVVAGTLGATDTIAFHGEINISGGTFSALGGQAFGVTNSVFNIIGDDATIGIDRFNNSIASRSPTINFEFDETGVSPIVCNGYMQLTFVTVNVDGSDFEGDPGVYTLMDSQNSLGISPAAATVTEPFPGMTAVISLDGNDLIVTLTEIPANPSTWDGETDSDWSVATNWVGDTALVADDELYFEGTSNATTNNDLAAGTAFRGINFSNSGDGEAFTLGGSSIQLDGDINSTVVATPAVDAISDTISLGIELTDDSTINLGEDHDLTISGILSEDASARGLTKTGLGDLTLTAANSYSGVTTISEGRVRITNNDALGSTAGGTVIGNGVRLELDGGLTIAEPITNQGGGTWKLHSVSGTNTIAAPITLESGMDLRGNNFVFQGGFTSANNSGPGLNGTNYIFETTPITIGTGTIGFTSAGNNEVNASQLNVGGNVWGLLRMNFGGYLKLGLADALPATGGVEFGWVTDGQSSGTLDLNGYDQTVAFLRQWTGAPTTNGNQNVTGGGTLTIATDAATYEYHGRITDGASPTSVVKTGTGTQIIDNQSGTASDYTGSTTIAGGTLSLSAAELDDGSTVSIATGAVLDLTHALTDDVAVLEFNGAAQPDGVYNAGNSGGFITGTGSIQVVSSAGGYNDWASTNAPSGTSLDDFDGDGVANGVEYVLGGTKDTNDLAKLPGLQTTGGNLVFEFDRDQASIDGTTTVEIEVGTDLASWPDSYAVGADSGTSDPEVTVTKDTSVGFDTVTLTLVQAPDLKKFARLSVTIGDEP